MEPDMNIARQVRKAVADIKGTLQKQDGDETRYSDTRVRKALYQLDMLAAMVSQSPERRQQPWSYFQPRVLEEFDED